MRTNEQVYDKAILCRNMWRYIYILTVTSKLFHLFGRMSESRWGRHAGPLAGASNTWH